MDETQYATEILDIANKSVNLTKVQGVQVTGSVNATTQQQELLKLEEKGVKFSHGEWVRKKDHEMSLRSRLIIEAKRDLLEQLVARQEEEAMRMQARSHQMYEWENRKRLEIQHRKLENLQEREAGKLKKVHRQEESYKLFKEWLKRSLIKQREDHIQKRVVKQEKSRVEDDKAKRAALRRVEAKIAYRDWKQNKLAEEKLR